MEDDSLIAALERYADYAEDRALCAIEEDPETECYPFVEEQTPELGKMLLSRVQYIREEIIANMGDIELESPVQKGYRRRLRPPLAQEWQLKKETPLQHQENLHRSLQPSCASAITRNPDTTRRYRDTCRHFYRLSFAIPE